jgi:hypothetical protein
MKNIVLFFATIAWVASIQAQTNTFPGSGNVGIGTTNPQVPLQIHVGTDQNVFFDSSLGESRISIVNDALNANPSVRFQAAAYNFVGASGAGPYLTINSVGNIGIGTTTPASDSGWASPALDISGARGTAIIRTTATNGIATLRMTGPGANHCDDWAFNMYAGSTSVFSIFPQAGNIGAAFTITNTGSVGIDTQSPTQALTVNGTVATIPSGGFWLNTAQTSGIADELPGGGSITFRAGDSDDRMVITAGGNVGIGTTTPGYALDVPNGIIHAQGVLVDMTGADYVFAPSYKLMPLSQVEQAIKRDQHLPGIPSAKEMSSGGVSVGDLQAKLLAKVEELTLHVIAQQKELDALKTENAAMQARLNTIAK